MRRTGERMVKGMDTATERRRIMKKLKMTGKGETVCLMDWEVNTLVEWLDSLIRQRNMLHNKNILLIAR